MDIARPDLVARKKSQKIALLASAIAGLAIVTGLAIGLGNSAPSVSRENLLLDTVRKGTFVRGVRGTGKLIPSQTRLAVARTEASVDRILVRAGSEVESDTIIISLVNPLVEERLQTANAAFSAAESDHIALRAKLQSDMFTIQSELAEVRGDYESAKIQEEAGLRASEMGVLSDVEYRRMKVEVVQLRERLKLAEQRVGQFKFNLEAQVGASASRLSQLKNAADLRAAEAESLQVRAGMNGILQRIEVEEGQRVAVGDNLARVAKPEGLIAELLIPESQASQLQIGLPATIQAGNKQIAGQILRVDPAISKGAVRVEISLTSDVPEGARPEQSIEGSITLGEVPQSLYVRRPVNTSPNRSGFVYKIIDSDTAERTAVQFGAESVTEVQILSGLEEGDQIVLSDLGSIEGAERIELD